MRELADTYDAEINDLHTPMKGHPEYHCDPGHFNPEAIALQGKQAADFIKRMHDTSWIDNAYVMPVQGGTPPFRASMLFQLSVERNRLGVMPTFYSH